MVNDWAKRCWAKNVFAGKRYFFLNKAKREKKNVESLDQSRRLEVPEKVRNVFCDEPTSVWPQGVTQHRIFKFFRGFARIFSLFCAHISYFKFLEFKEFNKTIIPFALVGYETGYRLVIWLFTISYPTRAHGIIAKYCATCVLKCLWSEIFFFTYFWNIPFEIHGSKVWYV